MATSTDTHISRVILDTKEAKEKLNELQAKLKDVQKAKDEAYAKGESATALERQIKRINAEIKNYQTSQQQVNDILKNLSSASYKDLQMVAKALNKELKSGAIERNSEEWKKLNEQLRKVRGEMASINGEARASGSIWTRMVNMLNKNWGAITQTIAGYSTLRDMMQKCSQAYADMEESMADVRKYTGQTDEQVHQMNEDFKRLDTRTAREQLNELAGSAGRLGITSKDMIEEFVDGADKINVALGDDLGKGAVDKIGKLAQMFGEDKTKGLRGAMLATGSAVNELAQNSSANAGYIVDFTADLSGVGIQAGMTQAQLMGLASALDQNMQEEATSATVFSQLITKMYQEPAKFAKIAGMEVAKFTNLMKTNANEGLMQFLTAMKSKGGFAEMAPMFEEMQLNGTRAVGVLSAVASHLDQVKTAQDLATKSYATGTSVLDEFNVQNNTVQAELDKAKKRFQDLAIELGEQLMPVTKYAISTMSIGVRVLSTMITFTISHAKQLAILGSAITICTALWYKETIAIKARRSAMAINEALDKAYVATVNLLKTALVALRATWALLTKGVEGYVAVMRAARLASLTNPWAALATVLTVVGVAIYGAVKATIAYNEAMRNNTQAAKNAKAVAQEQASLAKKVSDATLDERNKVDMLNKVIHSNAYTVDERRQAIAAMQKLVPEYHASISKEGQLYNDNQIAIQDYIKELENAAMAEAIYERKVEINKQKLDLKQKESRIRGSLKAVAAERQAHPERYKTEKTTIQSPDPNGQVNIYRDNDALKNSKKQEEIHNRRLKENLSLQEQLNAKGKYYNQVLEKSVSLQQQYNKVKRQQLYNSNGNNGTNTPQATPGHSTSEKERKKALAEQKKREAAARKAEAKEKAALKKDLDDAKKGNEAGLVSEEEYQRMKLGIANKYAKRYIDEMDLGEAVLDLTFQKVPGEEVVGKILAQQHIFDFYKCMNFGQLGTEGVFVLTPTYDETNDLIANSVFGKEGVRYVTNVAVHPNLIHLLERILNEEGYSVKRNDFAKYPWNRLYVASAYKSLELRKALPHWTAYTFIEEFRKLFNAHVLFDEEEKAVSILQNSELLTQEMVPLEPLDEYSVEYDEDGSLSTIDTSNIEYNLQDSANRQDNTVISQKVMEFFDVYVTKGMDPNDDLEIQKWDEKKKKTTIIQREDAGTEPGTHIMSHYVWMTDDEGNNGSWKMCGEFSPLIHDKDSDDSITLQMSPAATFVKDVNLRLAWDLIAGGIFSAVHEERPRIILSVPNDREVNSKERSEDDEGYSYVSVEDAMGDESSMDTSEDDDECLPIYFLDDQMQDGATALGPDCLCSSAMAEHYMAWPIPVTDDNSYWRFLNLRKGWSLSLVQRASYGISEFHKETHVDKNNCISVKFLSASIPDPSRIYMFRHKKYVCEKIEMDISSDSMDPLYTGYFYMMT